MEGKGKGNTRKGRLRYGRERREDMERGREGLVRLWKGKKRREGKGEKEVLRREEGGK